jgi:hypothetical protein
LYAELDSQDAIMTRETDCANQSGSVRTQRQRLIYKNAPANRSRAFLIDRCCNFAVINPIDGDIVDRVTHDVVVTNDDGMESHARIPSVWNF